MATGRTGLAARIAAQAVVLIALLVAITATSAWADVTQRARLKDSPAYGPGGTLVLLRGSRFVPNAPVAISFVDSNGTQALGTAEADATGKFAYWACIPMNGTVGMDTILAESPRDMAVGKAKFRVLSTEPVLAGGAGNTAGPAGAAPDSVCV